MSRTYSKAQTQDALRRLRRWLMAVVRKADDLQEFYKTHVEATARALVPGDVRSLAPMREAFEVLVVEQYFFVLAVNRALVWADVAGRADQTLKSAARAFAAALPKAKDLRDKLEHEVEYLEGRGKDAAYEHKLHQNVSIMAAPDQMLINGDTYIIGGRVTVADGRTAARELLRHVESALEGITREPV